MAAVSIPDTGDDDWPCAMASRGNKRKAITIRSFIAFTPGRPILAHCGPRSALAPQTSRPGREHPGTGRAGFRSVVAGVDVDGSPSPGNHGPSRPSLGYT